MSTVELYVYDLSHGLAKNLGSSLGLDIEGVWHTAIVVYGQEWFFGSGGIENVEPPATTGIGPPLKILPLGQTQIPRGEFMSLLTQLSHNKFKVGTYDLFRHNCNNFSQELAELLCEASIPSYILDLPNQILDSPVAQLFAPLIEKYTQPTGRAFIDSTTEEPKPLLPYATYEVFNSPIDAELFLTKFKSLCSKNKTAFSNSLEETFRSFFKSNKGNSSFLSFIWPFIDSHIDDWPEEDLVPFLDAIRWSVGLMELDLSTYKRIHNVCLRQIKGQGLKGSFIFRVILRIWCNFFVHEVSRKLIVEETESIILSLNSELHGNNKPLDPHAQKGVASVCLNFAVHNTQVYNEERSTIVLYGLIPEYLKHINCYKAAIRALYALGTYIIINPMAKQIAMALDADTELQGLNKRIEMKDFTYEEVMRECKKILDAP